MNVLDSWTNSWTGCKGKTRTPRQTRLTTGTGELRRADYKLPLFPFHFGHMACFLVFKEQY